MCMPSLCNEVQLRTQLQGVACVHSPYEGPALCAPGALPAACDVQSPLAGLCTPPHEIPLPSGQQLLPRLLPAWARPACMGRLACMQLTKLHFF